MAQRGRRQFTSHLICESFEKILIRFRPSFSFHPVRLFLSWKVQCPVPIPVPLGVELGGWDSVAVNLENERTRKYFAKGSASDTYLWNGLCILLVPSDVRSRIPPKPGQGQLMVSSGRPFEISGPFVKALVTPVTTRPKDCGIVFIYSSKIYF